MSNKKLLFPNFFGDRELMISIGKNWPIMTCNILLVILITVVTIYCFTPTNNEKTDKFEKVTEEEKEEMISWAMEITKICSKYNGGHEFINNKISVIYYNEPYKSNYITLKNNYNLIKRAEEENILGDLIKSHTESKKFQNHKKITDDDSYSDNDVEMMKYSIQAQENVSEMMHSMENIFESIEDCK